MTLTGHTELVPKGKGGKRQRTKGEETYAKVLCEGGADHFTLRQKRVKENSRQKPALKADRPRRARKEIDIKLGRKSRFTK